MMTTPNWWECCPYYPDEWYWGWKTRQPHWNDDAVRIWVPVMPTPGMQYEQGMPIEDAQGLSWDMAYVLTTPKWCMGDMDCSGGAPTFVDISYFVAALGRRSELGHLLPG